MPVHEIRAILDGWRGLDPQDADAVLATVVHVTGSAYRRPGARMLIIKGGRRIGSVSGGCLEGEIASKAWWLTESGPAVRTYDTTSDDDAVWEFGLGCNGVVHILLERATSPATREMLEFLDAHRASREPVVVATVVRPGSVPGAHAGDRLLLDERWVCGGSLVGSPLEEPIRAQAALAFGEARSRLAHIGNADVFVEWVAPPVSLVIFGAGDDAMPVVRMAGELGWRITVADVRPAFAKAARFAGAERVLVLDQNDPLGEIVIDATTAVVMMTHNYPLDQRLLPRVLACEPRYLGILGPRSRTARLFAERNLVPPAALHAPIGLDIGGDHPAATALAIVAEVQAHFQQRAGAMLRHRHAPIHAPAVEAGVADTTTPTDGVRPAFCETTLGADA